MARTAWMSVWFKRLLALGALVAGAVLLFGAGTVMYLRIVPTRLNPDPRELDPPTAATLVEQEALARQNPGFLYGRVTKDDGKVYEGRLRWGGGEEAFWGDYFTGRKSGNTWAAELSDGELGIEPRPFSFRGWFSGRDALTRSLLVRFGDIARIDSTSPFVVRVTLKSGTAYDTDYMESHDFADGVRVWDDDAGIVDLGPTEIQSVEFMPAARLSSAPTRLCGTVHTRRGDFSGFIQWNRRQSVGADRLDGQGNDGAVHLRFDAIRAIARDSNERAIVTLADGRDLGVSGDVRGGPARLGLYVDDERYGRVLVTWSAFERLEFQPCGTGPGYDDFRPGQPIQGRVTLRSGEQMAGRLVYDLDESETTDTLDASIDEVNYMLPFGRVASIALPGAKSGAGRATVTLRSGEVLKLELDGDLGERNAGVLVFAGDGGRRFVRWADVSRIDLD
jgi:hypothetical protein